MEYIILAIVGAVVGYLAGGSKSEQKRLRYIQKIRPNQDFIPLANPQASSYSRALDSLSRESLVGEISNTDNS